MRTERLEKDEIERFVDELWVTAQREMVQGKRYSLKDGIRDPGLAFNRSRLDNEDSVTFVARGRDGLVGYASADIQTPPPMVEQIRECHVLELFVEEGSRRCGIASELLEAVEDWGRSRGCEFVKLMVSSDNRAAIDLYESADYGVTRHSMKKPIGGDG